MAFLFWVKGDMEVFAFQMVSSLLSKFPLLLFIHLCFFPDLAMGTGRTIGYHFFFCPGYHPEHFLLGRVSSIKNLNGNGIT